MADLSGKTKETLLPTQSEEGLHEDAASATRRSWRKSTDALLFISAIVVSCIWLYHKAGLYTTSEYQPDGLEAQDASPFAWRRCPHSKDDRWRCGRLHVPMDYLNKSDHRTFQLETVLFSPLPGRKAERTILVNPGGPGGSGVAYAWGRAEEISRRYSNSTFDVLGWDPRGVNATMPQMACFPDNAYRDRWSALGVAAWRQPGDKEAEMREHDATNEALMKACRAKFGDIPRFLSTASVARDIDAIREALGEETMTYYGVSYGTGLGETAMQMFPDRAGRMIIDALEDIRDGRTTDGFGTAALHDIEKAWKHGFLGECAKAGPDYCALAQSTNETVEALEARMKKLLDSLLYRPQPAYRRDLGPGVIRYQDLVDTIYGALYRPLSEWPRLAQALAGMERGNGTLALELIERNLFVQHPEVRGPKRKKADDTEILVVCSDQYDAEHPGLDWYLHKWQQMDDRSWIGGNGRFSDILPCRHFDWTPSEVYRGNLSHSLRTPALLIAETHDPATPLVNGRRLFQEMGSDNARLVVHHGFGHGSNSGGYSEECTEKIKRHYMMTGELPEDDETQCYVRGSPFIAAASVSGDGIEGGAWDA
ncbi:unnamed protein product [Jaminaea pallidilutea]